LSHTEQKSLKKTFVVIFDKPETDAALALPFGWLAHFEHQEPNQQV